MPPKPRTIAPTRFMRFVIDAVDQRWAESERASDPGGRNKKLFGSVEPKSLNGVSVNAEASTKTPDERVCVCDKNISSSQHTVDENRGILSHIGGTPLALLAWRSLRFKRHRSGNFRFSGLARPQAIEFSVGWVQ